MRAAPLPSSVGSDQRTNLSYEIVEGTLDGRRRQELPTPGAARIGHEQGGAARIHEHARAALVANDAQLALRKPDRLVHVSARGRRQSAQKQKDLLAVAKLSFADRAHADAAYAAA